jgi:glutathione S-transferase
LCFVSASARAPTPTKHPALRLRGGRRTPLDRYRGLDFLCSFAEAEGFLYPPIRQVFEQLVLRQGGAPDEAVLAKARAIAGKKMAVLEQALRGHFFLGDQPTLADYAVYPLTALLVRLGTRRPDLDLAGAIPPGLADWRTRVEALPYLDTTWPPHWRG